jgi:hypothetical protein
MTFYGKVEEPSEEKPLRSFSYNDFGGRRKTVGAHYVRFAPDHVLFYRSEPEGKDDFLVLAANNRDVHQLVEEPPV